MFRIKVYDMAPDHMKHIEFWCNFLVGTHWRKFNDYAELFIERVEHKGYGELECLCKPFNGAFDGYGNKVRHYPVGGDSWFGERVDIATLEKHGFFLVPNSILNDGRSYSYEDSYIKKMNNLGWSNPDLRRVGVTTAYHTQALGNGRRGEPVATFSHGIPAGRVVEIKGLLIGREGTEFGCYYEPR